MQPFFWQEIPFVRLVPFLMIGILGGRYLPLPIGFVIGLFAIAGILTAVSAWRALPFRWRHLFGYSLISWLLALGYLITHYTIQVNLPLHFSHHIHTDNDYQFVGVVRQSKAGATQYRYELAVEYLASLDGKQVLPCMGKLQVSVPIAHEAATIGDRVVVSGKARPLRETANPYAFDYQQYLHTKNIYHQLYASAERWHLLTPKIGFPFWRWLYDARQQLLTILKTHLPSGQEFAVGAALILGATDYLDEKIMTTYAQTGAMHALSVSGMHVGIVMSLLTLLISRIPSHTRTGRLTKLMIVLGGVWLFALLSGASISVLRAALMFSFFNIGAALYRQANAYNILAGAAFLTLLYSPLSLFDVSFQLSYLAMVGLLFFSPRIEQLWQPSTKVGTYFWQMTAAGIAAQITTLPISLYYFHQFPTYFWLSAFIIVPASYVILYLGILLLVVYKIPLINIGVGKLLYGSVFVSNSLLYSIQHLPGSVLEGLWLTPLQTGLLYLILALGIGWVISRRAGWLVTSLCVAPLLLLHLGWQRYQLLWQNHIVVYQVYKQTLIDFINYDEVYTLRSTDLLPKTEKFAAQGMRWAKSRSRHATALPDTLHTTTLFKRYHIVQFGNMNCLVLHSNSFLKPLLPIPIDVLILTEDCTIELAELEPYYTVRAVVVAGSVTKRAQKARWEKYCAERHLPYHDVQQAGAWQRTTTLLSRE